MIDWGRVKDLRSEIGAEDFSDVVALFLEEADEVIARISASAGAKGLESDLHFLKGAALNLGFDALATVCQDGERRAAAGDVAIDLDRVRQVYTESKAKFDAGLGQACAA
jgi:HPt (histidine-containing phosphotransfer) domain-containing protein